jgi:hypothetical protein
MDHNAQLRTCLSVAFLAVSSFILLSDAKAADVSPERLNDGPAAPVSGWEVYWPTYLWAAGMNGTARTLPPLPAADVDISFGDSLEALKDLDAGLITTVFVNNGRFRLLGDVNWMRFSPEQKITFGGNSAKISTFSETLTLMGMVGYRLVDEERLALDVYVGAKYWYMDNSAKVKPALVTPNSIEKQHDWIDGVIGAEIISNLTDQVYVSAIAFAGTGGSKFYGDLYGGVGYRFNKKYDVFAGYRVMRENHEDGDFSYDIVQHGPLLGFGVKF